MLDEKRVKLMTKLALYEETQGKDDFKVSEYYRKDYVGMHLYIFMGDDRICVFGWFAGTCRNGCNHLQNVCGIFDHTYDRGCRRIFRTFDFVFITDESYL